MSLSKPQMGVFVTYNAEYAAELNRRTPIIATQPLPGPYGKVWMLLPLTEALGIPLLVMKLDVLDQNGPSYYNEIVSLLSLCPDAPSVHFCKPTIEADFSAVLARADGEDLEPEVVRAMVEYVKREMPGLVTFGRDSTDGEVTDGAEGEGGEEREVRLSPPMVKASPMKFAKFLVELEA